MNNDGTQRMQTVIVNGSRSFVPVTQTIPSYQLTFPGGDTNIIPNFGYRIPIFGPVVLALFGTAGIDNLPRPGHLKLNPEPLSHCTSHVQPTAVTRRSNS